MDKLEVRSNILCCTACELHKVSTPVPFSGPEPTDVAVLGEAPGKDEDAQGRPFVGRAGQLLREVLAETGWDVSSLFFCNTTSCMPRQESGRGRTPYPKEVNACSGNREVQLQLSGARWIIVTGNVPLQAYRPDLRIGKMHGRPLMKVPNQKFPVLMPVYHPAAVLRNPAWRSDLKSDLSYFRTLVDAGDVWLDLSSTSCVVCGEAEEKMNVWKCDSQSVPYCLLHWEAYAPEGRK